MRWDGTDMLENVKESVKNQIKKRISWNTYFNANVYRYFSTRSIEEMNQICEEAAMDDSIRSVEWLKQYRRDIDSGKRRFFTTDSNWANAHIYGNWYGMFGRFNLNPIYTPSVEHGLIFHKQIFGDIQDTARASAATFGEFRKKIIRKYTDIPVFCVGPYIHYADSFYSEDEILREKKKNGKTLLFFPTHGTERDNLSFEIEKFRRYLKSMEEKYDTILVNAFWWNLNEPLFEALQSDGYRIVSAGFREDLRFMSRLKTLILLADHVAGDSVGTHIGYCVECGVPFGFVSLGTTISSTVEKENRDTQFVTRHMQRIEKAFYESETITEEQKRICDYYWGLGSVKTKEELKEIVRFNYYLTRLSKGNMKMIHSIAIELAKNERWKNNSMIRKAIQ